MGRTRSPNRDKAFEAYKKHDGKISSKEISDLLNEKVTNIYAWKKNDKWDKKLHKRVGAPEKNQNALGNTGGAPKGNLNNLQHGEYYDPRKHLKKDFLKKYLPTSTRNIIKGISESGINTLDILWTNIQLQFSAILRSQKIMNVKNKKDITKELKKVSKGKTNSTEFDIQYAHDKQGKFLHAQSKAIKTLVNLIREYEDLLHKNWELATEEQKFRIEKLKNDISKTNNKDNDDGVLKEMLEGLKNGI